MLAKKISFTGAILFVALALFMVGCTPAGPRALLKGKKLLDQGDYASATAELKIATALLATNATAWNYYGVALQGAGNLDDAAAAYQTALKFDRDLMEAHFNLGGLCLEQDKSDLARTEFTAYTLRRPNEAAGWLKLGMAQLKLGDPASAERSFSTVYHMDANSAEALNGLGMARIYGGKPQDAAKFFAAAIYAHPDYAPAILNLATVSQQYLHDNKTALDNYHAYLALKTRPANWSEVYLLASNLEQAEARSAAVAPPAAPVVQPPLLAIKEVRETKPPAKINASPQQHPFLATKPPSVKYASPPLNLPPVKPVPVQVVEVNPAPPIVATPRAYSPPAAPVTASDTTPTAAPASADAPMPFEVPVPAEAPKKSFWGKLFAGNSQEEAAQTSKYLGEGLTPMPGGNGDGSQAQTKPVVVPAAKPLEVVAPVPVFARYNYFSPPRPLAGDRAAASGAFTQARLYEQSENWVDALQSYEQAAALDPTWFEAQYNSGVVAHRLRNFSTALPRYELALSLQPNSTDARYNFALALKSAGYVLDAAEQLKIILAAQPDEVRAHLALANICAQSLRDNAQAREHYLKVLELDPSNPQTSDIRFWLSENPS